MENLKELQQQLIEGRRLDYEQLLEMTHTLSDEQLYALADGLRTHFEGRHIDLCSIMNARSGRCSENCKWCSQSKYHHTSIDIYPLVDEQQAVDEAAHNAAKGVGRFSLVTSGRTLSDEDTRKVCAMYRRIGNEVSISLCGSLGLLNKEQLQKLYDSGLRRYHCNMETAPSFFPKLCTTHTIAEKLRTIGWAREVGMEICCGGIIGMGESESQRVEFACALRETGAVSIPINVLHPIEGTPLAGTPPLTDREVLRAAAILRIANPKATIRLAGGRMLIKKIEPKLLFCGVSATIVGDLLTTTGSDIDTDKKTFRALGFEL